MTGHTATVEWQRNQGSPAGRRYSRVHDWRFDGGARIPASSSPHVVPVPMSDPACVDPEEAYIAALASCHMLWFLDLATQAGYVVDRYVDAATGHMLRDDKGKWWVGRVELAPSIAFSGRSPDSAQLEALHDKAHHECYLANSVKTEVVVASGASA